MKPRTASEHACMCFFLLLTACMAWPVVKAPVAWMWPGIGSQITLPLLLALLLGYFITAREVKPECPLWPASLKLSGGIPEKSSLPLRVALSGWWVVCVRSVRWWDGSPPCCCPAATTNQLCRETSPYLCSNSSSFTEPQSTRWYWKLGCAKGEAKVTPFSAKMKRLS